MKKLILTFIVFILFILLSNSIFAQFTNDSLYYSYKGIEYKVEHGSKGGKYILLSDSIKKYISNEIWIDINDKYVIYRGINYNVLTGTKGGKYILIGERKKYLNIYQNTF